MTRASWRWQMIFILLVSFLGPSPLFAETKSEPSQPVAPRLVSLERGDKAKVSSEAKKKEVILPEMDPLDEKAEGTLKTLEGEVAGINHYGIAVMYEVDLKAGSSKELWLNFLKETKLSGVSSFSEFGYGDKVSATYKEIKGSQKRVIKSLALIQKKPKEPEAPAEAEPEESGETK